MATYVCFDHMVTYGKMTIKSDIPLLPRSLKTLSKSVSNSTAFLHTALDRLKQKPKQTSQVTFICSKSTTETLDKGVKFGQR